MFDATVQIYATARWNRIAATSSARLYWEDADFAFYFLRGRDRHRAPRRWAERTYHKLVYWNEAERGGHFAAVEQPGDIHARRARSVRQLR